MTLKLQSFGHLRVSVFRYNDNSTDTSSYLTSAAILIATGEIGSGGLATPAIVVAKTTQLVSLH